MLSIMLFMAHAFGHHVRGDFDRYLKVEGDKWQDAGVPHNADYTIAEYLRTLNRGLKKENLDLGFYLPHDYAHYRTTDKWPANKRPIPTKETPSAIKDAETPSWIRSLPPFFSVLARAFADAAGVLGAPFTASVDLSKARKHQTLADALTDKHAEAIHKFINQLPTHPAMHQVWTQRTHQWTQQVLGIMREYACTKQEVNHVETISQFDLVPYGEMPPDVAMFLVRVQRVADISTEHTNAAKAFRS